MEYIRKIMYLQERQGGKMRPVRGGTARLIRRNGVWRLDISAGESGFTADAPVLLVGEYEDICYVHKCGVLGDWAVDRALDGEAEDFLTAVKFMGIFIGNAGHYLAGADISERKSVPGFRFSNTRTWRGLPTAGQESVSEAPVFSRLEGKGQEKRGDISNLSGMADGVEASDGKYGYAGGEKRQTQAAEPEEPEHSAEKAEEISLEADRTDSQPGSEQKENCQPAPDLHAAENEEVTRFSPMYPFEDDEFDWCYQIHPQDLKCFAAHQWHLAENTFLLQGFYNYRHLIYAHRHGKNYIGVPGQFHRREQYLAARFGFCEFKGTKRKRVTVGDYGYWLYEMEI